MSVCACPWVCCNETPTAVSQSLFKLCATVSRLTTWSSVRLLLLLLLLLDCWPITIWNEYIADQKLLRGCQTTDNVVKSHQICHHGVQLHISLFQDITQITCHSLCCAKKGF